MPARIELDETRIQAIEEAPRALFVVPWRRPPDATPPALDRSLVVGDAALDALSPTEVRRWRRLTRALAAAPENPKDPTNPSDPQE